MHITAQHIIQAVANSKHMHSHMEMHQAMAYKLNTHVTMSAKPAAAKHTLCHAYALSVAAHKDVPFTLLLIQGI